jgi:Flp pilus assembly protein TadG
MTGARTRGWRGERGQTLVELAFLLPMLAVLAMGVVELSYALLDEHVVTRLSREGSNLTSRDTALLDAANALKSMASAPVDFTTRSTVILSVITRVATTGAANYGKDVLYQRYQYGAIAATSALHTRGSVSIGGGPDFKAANPDTDTNLQLTNLPANLLTTGGMLYVTEVFSTHTLLTPLDALGVPVPTTLYSIAYF